MRIIADLPVQLVIESDSFPSKSKKPDLHSSHLLPIYPIPHVQAPFASQGHGSVEVQIDPSAFKEPSI